MQSGTILGDKYRLDEIIGEGGSGVVWRARQLGLDRAVAIKVLGPAFARDAEARTRFTREARVAATLVHAAAVAVLDFGEADGSLYLVMELLVGRSLRDRLERPPAPAIAEVATIGAQVAGALIAAHHLHLVHRDIKPENVFLEATADGERVKVVDFGLAFIAAHDAGSLGRMTEDGMLSGTPSYMSPEQVRGEGVGPAADVYALGCLLYEAIVGHPPFGGSLAELLTRQVYQAPAPMRRAAADRAIDPLLDELVLGMLAKSPLLRTPLERVRATLDAFAGNSTAQIGRSGLGLLDRAAQGVPTPHHATSPGEMTPHGRDETISVTWIGAWSEPLALALMTNAIHPVQAEPAAAALIYAPRAELDALARWIAMGADVVTDVPLDDLPSLTALLRIGVVDVVTRPVRPDDLARKLRRAHRASVLRRAAVASVEAPA